MLNARKILGLCAAAAGVLLARIDVFVTVEKTLLFMLNATGILLAFVGITIYASGMPSTKKRFKACPTCFFKNDAAAVVCAKCKQPFPDKTDHPNYS